MIVGWLASLRHQREWREVRAGLQRAEVAHNAAVRRHDKWLDAYNRSCPSEAAMQQLSESASLLDQRIRNSWVLTVRCSIRR